MQLFRLLLSGICLNLVIYLKCMDFPGDLFSLSFDDFEQFTEACYKGDCKKVESFLADPDFNPSANDCRALMIASGFGKTDIVKQLLTSERDIDPAAQDNMAIRQAVVHGHYYTVEFLLSDERVDPSAWDNHCIWAACANGDLDIVKLLLAHGKVNPSARNNAALLAAIENGHTSIVRLLLDDERVNPADPDIAAIETACQGDSKQMLKILVASERVDPAARDNIALLTACRKGWDDVVEIILNNPKVDPSTNANEMMKLACDLKHGKVMKWFLAHPKIDVNAITSYVCNSRTSIYIDVSLAYKGLGLYELKEMEEQIKNLESDELDIVVFLNRDNPEILYYLFNFQWDLVQVPDSVSRKHSLVSLKEDLRVAMPMSCSNIQRHVSNLDSSSCAIA